MKLTLAIAALLLIQGICLAGDPPPVGAKWHPGHYVFVGHQPIRSEHMLDHFRGVQRCYTWKALEPQSGQYDFSSIRSDIALLQQSGKQLVIQMQYKAFGKDECYVPDYVRGEEYGGGIYRAHSGSANPVIWNLEVGERMDALFAALGREFDENDSVEAMVLPDTAPSANLSGAPQAGVQAYTDDLYFEALRSRMSAMRHAFPHTVVIQYANFPQKLLPELTDYMKQIGVGLGGPDVYPRPSNLSDPAKGVYRLYAPLAGTVPLGAAVQYPDYSVANWKRTAASNRGLDRDSVQLDPDDEKPIPVREHLKLARSQLKLNYLFWAASPKYLENVKKMLAESDLANDPAGGLRTEYPSCMRRP